MNTGSLFQKNIQRLKTSYIPDAIIKMKSPRNKEYHFIVEFERTKCGEDVRCNKSAVNRRLKPFNEYGLNKYIKFPYIYTYHSYNVFWRPLEYDVPEVQNLIKTSENSLVSLIQDSKTYLNDWFRFLPFHKFNILNQKEWLNYKGEKISLINE